MYMPGFLSFLFNVLQFGPSRDIGFDPSVCQLPLERGPCIGYSPRYWHNGKTEKCELFFFGGCGGNDNNFDDEIECLQRCGKKTKGMKKSVSHPGKLSSQKTHGVEKQALEKQDQSALEKVQNDPTVPAEAEKNVQEDPRKEEETVPEQKEDQSETAGPTAPEGPKEDQPDTEAPSKDQSVIETLKDTETPNEEKAAGEVQEEKEPAGEAQEEKEAAGALKEENAAAEEPKEEISTPETPREDREASEKPAEDQSTPGTPIKDQQPVEVPVEVAPAEKGESQARVDVCRQPLEAGQCRAIVEKYGYNYEARQCEKFNYGGCGGNGNKFDTESDCVKACADGDDTNPSLNVPQADEGQKETKEGEVDNGQKVVEEGEVDVCQKPMDSGPCRAMYTRYGYNNETGECEGFVYGGCGGNGNNFKEVEECQEKCLPEPEACYVGNPEPGNTTAVNDSAESTDVRPLPPMCDQPQKIGPCRASKQRFWYNKESKKCEKFVFGGCRGNDNNFLDEKICVDTCIGGEPSQGGDMELELRKGNETGSAAMPGSYMAVVVGSVFVQLIVAMY